MPKISRRTIDLIAECFRDQGARVRRTQAGYFIQYGEWGTSIHYTESDTRAMKNTRARCERNGLKWPEKL